jgi:hypothetical protein
MHHFRTRWLVAVGSAAMLLASTSGAFAGQSHTWQSTGLSVSPFVHHAVGDIEEQTDPVDETTEEPADAPDATDATDSSAHGACVSAVAKSDAVGGAHNNHGGAVSEAARVTCWQPAVPPVVTDGTGDPGTTGTTAMTTFRTHGSGHGAARHNGK